MDADPWPLVIEDYDGNTNSVVLKVMFDCQLQVGMLLLQLKVMF